MIAVKTFCKLIFLLIVSMLVFNTYAGHYDYKFELNLGDPNNREGWDPNIHICFSGVKYPKKAVNYNKLRDLPKYRSSYYARSNSDRHRTWWSAKDTTFLPINALVYFDVYYDNSDGTQEPFEKSLVLACVFNGSSFLYQMAQDAYSCLYKIRVGCFQGKSYKSGSKASAIDLKCSKYIEKNGNEYLGFYNIGKGEYVDIDREI